MINKMKIGIDFHGVINSNSDFFREFINIALENQIEIYVISGGPYDSIEKYLSANKIKYTKLWCIFNYYEHSKNITYFEDGSFKVDDKLWNTAKSEYCKKENICLHIDDSTIYERNFETPYCLYDERKKCCFINNKQINLNNPQQAFEDIMQFCKI